MKNLRGYLDCSRSALVLPTYSGYGTLATLLALIQTASANKWAGYGIVVHHSSTSSIHTRDEGAH